ncbi:hypothetical protein KY362_02620 [Candidatus Woesearchaeota archaeon]|nr:hypothetical protein [Candidatus Woesearchaeota archaeon]
MKRSYRGTVVSAVVAALCLAGGFFAGQNFSNTPRNAQDKRLCTIVQKQALQAGQEEPSAADESICSPDLVIKGKLYRDTASYFALQASKATTKQDECFHYRLALGYQKKAVNAFQLNNECSDDIIDATIFRLNAEAELDSFTDMHEGCPLDFAIAIERGDGFY